MSLVGSIIKKIAPQIGAVVVIEPEYETVGHITFKNGNKSFFFTTTLDINGHGSSELAKDKSYSNFFLKNFGYKTTIGKNFFNDSVCARLTNPRNIDDGFNYAKEIGFPVIVKPLNLSQGKLVTKVFEETEYYDVARKILLINSGLIVEKFYSGNDYRIVVLENEVIAAYQRIPLYVVGDGKSSILELIHQKQENFIKNGRKNVINVNDFRISQKLQRQNLNFNSILSENALIYLLDNANLSCGGEAIDLTESIHPDFQKLAINVTRDMGLKLAGVDIITNDITATLADYTIIEINSSPGLYHYASICETHTKRVENLYWKILQILDSESVNFG